MPKRLLIMALGSRGDVQPYVALGAGLRRAGYQVRVATFESFQGLVASAGLDFHPVAGDAQALTSQLASGDGMGTRNPFAMMRKIMDSFGAMGDAYIAAFADEALRDSDAVLCQLPGALFGSDLAEALNVPLIIVSVIPLTATGAFPNPLLATRSFGSLGNHLSYQLSAQLLWAGFRPIIARFRKRLGLRAPAWTLNIPDAPVIHGFSPRVVVPPADWGPRVHTTGWWTLDEADWQPPAELTGFLAAGAPPVYIGFGSMNTSDNGRLNRLIIDAVQQAGVRAVLGSGWAGLGGDALPNTIYRLDYAPYRWLLPQMAAVVHHGGSGTTGLALRSGSPSMVVAFGADQPYWGTRTAALGAGLPPIPVKKLTAEALAAALRRLVSDAALREGAAALGAALRTERGLDEAVRVICGYVGESQGRSA